VVVVFAVVVKGFIKLAEKRRFIEDGMLDDNEAKVDEGAALVLPPPEEETDEGDMMWLRKGLGLMDDDPEKVAIEDVDPAAVEEEAGPGRPKEVDMDRRRGMAIDSGAVSEVLLLLLLLLLV